MKRHGILLVNGCYLLLFSLILSACAPKPTVVPTATLTEVPTETSPPSTTPTITLTITQTATITLTPTLTPTATNTFLPTPTLTATLTPTATDTPYPSQTPTPTATPVPARPARLFYSIDADGRRVDWSYAQMTDYTLDAHGKTKHLSAMLAFQLLDRGIHWTTLLIADRPVTVYFLNVAHNFGQGLTPMRLILGGMEGKDVDIASIPAGGNSYIRLRIMSYQEGLGPFTIHRDANLPYAQRVQKYPDVMLLDLQKKLPELPDQLIVLADQTIMVDPTSWQQVQNDMTSVAYLAARYLPFISLDDYSRVVGPSNEASSLENYFLRGAPPGKLASDYSTETLVLITRP